MPTVVELSDPYANFLRPLLEPSTPGVCAVCLTLIEEHYSTCRPCGSQARGTDAVLPISFSVHMGQLHDALRGYKRGWASAPKLKQGLAAVLWRFVHQHESCLARRAGAASFDIVTMVPSSDQDRDARHPLPDIVGRLVRPTSDRYERLLTRSDVSVEPRTVSVQKYTATRHLGTENVLLIDDTWTTGANAQSAALALKAAGAGKVGVVVIGRHIHEDYGDNARRLKALPRFSWERCAFD